MPTPYSPSGGSVNALLGHFARGRTRPGIWIRMPAPSPCSGSAPDRAAVGEVRRICRPCSTIAWLFLPLIWAMKPTPQASCSLDGS